jgi:methionyl-tRNA synthetase
MEHIDYETFEKMDIRIGTIREVEPVPETDKLLRCQVDFGAKDTEGKPQLVQIVSGIHQSYPDYAALVGKQTLYIANLTPRTIKGFESHGMLLAVKNGDGKIILLHPESEVDSGTKIG